MTQNQVMGIKMEGFSAAKELQSGHEVKRGDRIDTVWYCYDDPEGTWIDFESGDCGYVNPDAKYWVINL
jgi:hypothetical protein